MMIHQVCAQVGRHKRRKRVGRGESSGLGRTSGRGNKGSQARSGGGAHPLHEGGQMPLFRRLPKRGFSNARFRRVYQVVNLDVLDRHFEPQATVDPQALRGRGLVEGADPLVKILGRGSVSRPLTVRAHAFSESARRAIEAAGGRVEVIPGRDVVQAARARRGRGVARQGDDGRAAVSKE